MQTIFVFLILSSFCFTVAADDYYSVLGVSTTSSQEEIEKAYRRLHMRFHPDRVSVSGIPEEQAEEMAKAINEAYSVLSDPVTRHSYDENLRRGTQNASNTVNDNGVIVFWALKRRINGEITAKEYKSIIREYVSSIKNSVRNGEMTLREARRLLKEYKREYKYILGDSVRNDGMTLREYQKLLKEHRDALMTISGVTILGIGQVMLGAPFATNLMAEDVTLVGFAGGYLTALGTWNLCVAAFSKYKKQREQKQP